MNTLKTSSLSRLDVAVLMGSVVRRYRRGEITERTANRETLMLKALVDGMDKGEPDAGPLAGARAREEHGKVWDRILTLLLSPGMERTREKFHVALKETQR